MGKVPFLDLGKQPLANGFLTKDQFKDEYFYNLSYSFDENTCLIKQDELVEPPKMFNERYPYHTSGSETMREHFKSIAERSREFLINPETNDTKILEIGSNDGAFILNSNAGSQKIAVEPCSNFAKLTNDKCVKTYISFWNTNTAFNIMNDYGKIDLIYSANCMCHIPDIEEALFAVSTILKDGGYFIMEDPYILPMLQRMTYDQLYDEHVTIFSVIGLKKILGKFGLYIENIEPLDIHGGSNRFIITKQPSENREILNQYIAMEKYLGLDKPETYIDFGKKVELSRKLFWDVVEDYIDNNKKIISYGATSKSTTIFNYYGVEDDVIDYITDTTPDKQGKFSPGVHIPVISPEEGLTDDVEAIYLGAWNFINEIKVKEQEYFKGKDLITHLLFPRKL